MTKPELLNPAGTTVASGSGSSAANSSFTATPPANLLGDWQSSINDYNYAGDVTYSIKADGKVLITLLILGKDQNKLFAERHEFTGTFSASSHLIKLVQVKGTCPVKDKETAINFVSNASESDSLSLTEVNSYSFLRLHRIKGGLTRDVHSVKDIRGHRIEEGCFPDGRLNQFVPVTARG